MCPRVEFAVGGLCAAVGAHRPKGIGLSLVGCERLVTGIDGHHHKLRPVACGYLVDEFGSAQGSTVDAHLVGTGIEQACSIVDGANAATHGERYVYAVGNAADELRKGVASLACGTDVEVDQLVGAGAGIMLPKGHGIAHVLQVLKVHALYSAALFHIEAWYNSFAQHNWSSVIRPS